jgi:hypothetical protein
MEMASQLAQEGVGSLARAQALERGNDFVRAVDAYLSLTPADVENLDVLQQCWEQVSCAAAGPLLQAASVCLQGQAAA